MSSKAKGFKCMDSRKPSCGGKRKKEPRKGYCACLDSGYPDGKCPFYKPDFSMTDGIYYPYVKPLGKEYPTKKAVNL